MNLFYRVMRVCEWRETPSLPAYWVESTAPINVEDNANIPDTSDDEEDIELEAIRCDDGVGEIVQHLKKSRNPEIVISVHGFGNRTAVARQCFAQAYKYMNRDLSTREGLVFIGYHWPSESIAQPLGSWWRSAPYSLLWLLFSMPVLLVALRAFLQHNWRMALALRFAVSVTGPMLLLTFLILLSIPLATTTLRAVSYFRDGYRAMNYGVPDLLELIRDIDKRLHKEHSVRVKLSFVGHSMGGFVVTHLVRILSDVFNPGKPSVGHSMGGPVITHLISILSSVFNPGKPNNPDNTESNLRDTLVSRDIGSRLKLGRLVLVAPDIPAEMLMTNRANFLAPSLRRFEEVYLFSSGGDIVLDVMSTIANHFSFPTSDRRHGYRLGNVEVVNKNSSENSSPQYGLLNLGKGLGEKESADEFLQRLRVGYLTLAELGATINEPNSSTSDVQFSLPERFTYVDCTDYREKGRHYLTRSKCVQKLRWYNKLSLLITYALLGSGIRCCGPDVHSGYFAGPLTCKMIYGVASLGFKEFLNTQPIHRGGRSYHSHQTANSRRSALESLHSRCEDARIKVLLSPALIHDIRKDLGGHGKAI